MEIAVYSGPDSIKRAPRGRTVGWYDDERDKRVEKYLELPAQYMRKYQLLKHPDDGHILTDDEIDLLLRSINHGFSASKFDSTTQFIQFLKYRNQVPERVYGDFEGDIVVCRFFNNGYGEKQENILADIRKMNKEQGMGNVKIPNTDIEIINYSPCPKCGHIHSFADIFNYYKNPKRDLKYKTLEEQRVMDTRVVCIECEAMFLPALIVSDGSPQIEHQMICRTQTIREIVIFMLKSFKTKVLYMKEENVIVNKEMGMKAWRNDLDAAKLKYRPGLFSNLLHYTPAPLMLDFLSRKNLELEEPIYGVWQKPDKIRYQW
jgi:hypothetical protein